MIKTKFIVLWFSPRGFNNEGTYIYGCDKEVTEFYLGSETSASSFGGVTKHRTLQAAENMAERKAKKDQASYRRQAIDCYISAQEISEFLRPY